MQEHSEETAKAIGREAAREVLMLLGIDASTPDGIQRAQRNYAFLDDLRSGTQAVKHKTIWLFLSSILTAAAAYIAIHFQLGK